MDTITIRKNDADSRLSVPRYRIDFYNSQGRELYLHSDKEFSATEEGRLWVFEIREVITFFWISGEKEVKYICHKKYTEELLKYWSLHTILPFFFMLEEHYGFIHAGAIEVKGKPILFIAKSNGGKSTMTDFFIKKGHTMISDDKVPLVTRDDQIIATSSHPHHRPYRKVEDLGFFVENFATTPKPIHAIYELKKSTKDAEVTISELTGMEKFQRLHLSNPLYLFFLKKDNFKFATEIANRIPVYCVTVPWDKERLQEVYDKIKEHNTHQS